MRIGGSRRGRQGVGKDNGVLEDVKTKQKYRMCGDFITVSCPPSTPRAYPCTLPPALCCSSVMWSLTTREATAVWPPIPAMGPRKARLSVLSSVRKPLSKPQGSWGWVKGQCRYQFPSPTWHCPQEPHSSLVHPHPGLLCPIQTLLREQLIRSLSPFKKGEDPIRAPTNSLLSNLDLPF